MSKEYGFTKLSEVEVTSELKDGDVILVVQDGAVKRYTGKVGGGSSSVCVLEIGDIEELPHMENITVLPYTFYNKVFDAVNNNECILLKFPLMGSDMRCNVISCYFSPESNGIPEGIVLFSITMMGEGGFFVPKEEFEIPELPSEPQ